MNCYASATRSLSAAESDTRRMPLPMGKDPLDSPGKVMSGLKPPGLKWLRKKFAEV